MLADWHDFFITAATCAATLTGLITVGVSLSLQTILQYPLLPNKALGAVLVLMTALLVSLLNLVPGEHVRAVGAGVLGCGLLGWGSLTWLEGKTLRNVSARHRVGQGLNLLLTQLALLPYLAAGTLLLESREAGVRWLVPALLLSLCKAALDAWVLLIEVHR